MSTDPSTLLTSAANGDRAAVETLLARYAPDVQAFLARRAPRNASPHESSSDLAQSVCREALEALGSRRLEFRGEPEFRSWLFQAALWKLGQRRRQAAARASPRGDAALDRTGAPELAAEIGTPSSIASLAESRGRLERAIERLPERERAVVRLAHLEQLEHREIAARLAISEGNSRVILTRALSRLAVLLQER